MSVTFLTSLESRLEQRTPALNRYFVRHSQAPAWRVPAISMSLDRILSI